MWPAVWPGTSMTSNRSPMVSTASPCARRCSGSGIFSRAGPQTTAPVALRTASTPPTWSAWLCGIGMPLLDGLRTNRMPHQWLALGQEAVRGSIAFLETGNGDAPLQRRAVDLLTEPVALPFAAASLDLLVLPHTLELSIDPHAALREVERVLVPEGRVVISGLNPTSLWGLRQWRARMIQRLGGGTLYLPDVGEFIGYRRLRDWLRLLRFEVESAPFGCYRPAGRGPPRLGGFWVLGPFGC